MRAGRSEVLAAPVAAALTSALFFHNLLFGRGVFVANDMVLIHVPFRHFIARTLATGELPLWTRDAWLGAPFLANGDAALLYPLQLFFFVMDPARAVGWEIWLHETLALLSVYLLARLSLAVSPLAAFAAGAAFAYGGYTLFHDIYLSEIYAAPWPPLVLLSLERTMTLRRLPWALLTPPAVALSILAGNPQELYWTLLFAPLFALALLLGARGDRLRAAGAGLAVLGGVVLGAALAAVQLLPQAELVGQTARRQLTFAEASLFPLTKAPWFTVLPDYRGTFTGENTAWIGLLGVLLAGFGLASARTSRRRLVVVGLLCLTILVAYVLALGAFTPAYRLAYDLLPGMRQFRFPARFLYPLTIALALLVGMGLDELGRLARTVPALTGRALVAAGAGLIVAALAAALLEPRLETHALAPLAAVSAGAVVGSAVLLLAGRSVAGILPLLLLELYSASAFMSWNVPGPADYYTRPHPLVAAVEAAGGRALPGPDLGWDRALADLGGNTPLLWGGSTINGAGGNWPAGRSQNLDVAATPYRPQMLRALAVRYVVMVRGEREPGPELQPVAEDGDLILYEVEHPMPRAWFSCGADSAASADAALARVLAPDFAAARPVLEGTSAKPGGECGQARISLDRQDRLEVAVSAPEDGWLVVADSFYPGWTAAVDGHPAAILHADYWLRAVPVAAGEHRVVLDYEPLSFRAGLAVSGAGGLAWLGLLGLALRRPRAGRSASPSG